MNDDTRALIYGQMADRLERDPIGPDGSGRAVVVNGRGFRWARFHNVEDLTWVTTLEGKMVGLTPWQAKVYDLARTYMERGTTTVRGMAQMLGCSPSTVSRALVKLMAWGLLGYMTGRGKYSGMLIFKMHKGDGLDRFRQVAKDKVLAWKRATEARVSRLWANVAPYILEEGRGRDTLTDAYLSTPIAKVATLKAWTPEELRDAGII